MSRLEPFMILTEPKAETRISPFIFRPYKVERVRGKDCSTGMLKKLLRQQELTDVDVIILNGLLSYGYLGGYMLRNYISCVEDSGELMKADAFRGRMRELVKMGLVCQIELTRELSGKRVGSAFIYVLTSSGLRFLKLIDPALGNVPVADYPMEQMLNELVVNQFMVMLQKQYGDSLAGCYYGLTLDSSCGAQAMFDLWLPDHSRIRMFLFAVRDSEHYKGYYLKRLRKIQEYARKSGSLEYTVLVICESEKQAMDCARYKGCDSQLADMELLYVTDTVGVSDNVFGRMIEISSQRDYSTRKIFKLEL